MYTENQRNFLLKLARNTLERVVSNKNPPDLEKFEDWLMEPRATFVTLTISGELRGCIGSITPHQELYKDVMRNAKFAALRDSRFEPVTKEELSDIEIEISVLTPPKRLDYSTPKDLLSKIKPHKHGIILQIGSRSATLLPQVWEELPNKEEFLGHICMKAGFSQDTWKKEHPQVYLYEVEHFKEE